MYKLTLLLGGITSCSASDSAYFYTFLRSVVCLSVVCHIRGPCLNRSTDLDGTWHAHLWGPVIHCYMGLPDRPSGRGSNPQLKRALANCSQSVSPMLPRGEYKRGVEWTWQIDSAFCQITLVLVAITNSVLGAYDVSQRAFKPCACEQRPPATAAQSRRRPQLRRLQHNKRLSTRSRLRAAAKRGPPTSSSSDHRPADLPGRRGRGRVQTAVWDGTFDDYSAVRPAPRRRGNKSRGAGAELRERLRKFSKQLSRSEQPTTRNDPSLQANG